jgi:ferric-dicitrate binding protein FerR (iron transport regulator)
MSDRECRFTQSCFLGLEGGHLLRAEAARVRAHLDGCADCRRAWERWQADDHRLRQALTQVLAPAGLADPVLARIRREAAARRAPVRLRTFRWAAAAAAAALLLALGAWALLRPHYEPIGQLAAAEGEVLARQKGARHARPLQAGATVFDGDELLAGAASRAAVEFNDKSRLDIAEGTDVELHAGEELSENDCDPSQAHVCLQAGEVEMELRSLRYFRAIGTPLATAIARDTRLRMKHIPGQRVLLQVLEGEVLFSSPRGQVRVTPGGVWVVESDGFPKRLHDHSNPFAR